MHYFMCGVDSHQDDPDSNIRDVYDREVQDDFLQTLTTVKFENEDGKPSAPHLLLMGDQRTRDITRRDINQLHYLLNISIILPQSTITVSRKKKHSVALFQWVFEKLNSLPLHDAVKLRQAIVFDLGIPLFLPEYGFPLDDVIPIHKQWTYLSYFLQMCSAVTMSPIEGGHRTWEFIKFYTGAPFDDFTPQPFEPIPIRPDKFVIPNTDLKPQGLSQTRYQFYFWQRSISKKGEFRREVAHSLQKSSLSLKEHQEVGCADTNMEFC